MLSTMTCVGILRRLNSARGALIASAARLSVNAWERTMGEGPTLEIAVPYLAATYDERMFEELYRRAQLFEVTLGGEMRVEGRIDPEHVVSERRQREKLGIGTDDEDIGDETDETGVVDLPADMIERLRVDLSVWKPPAA